LIFSLIGSVTEQQKCGGKRRRKKRKKEKGKSTPGSPVLPFSLPFRKKFSSSFRVFDPSSILGQVKALIFLPPGG
jgi:hypothetical protein